jgi:VanZ family protein
MEEACGRVAAVLEVLQTFSPGRHPAAEDWLASSAGVLLGIGAAIRAGNLWRQ